jgi:hypothetical protein
VNKRRNRGSTSSPAVKSTTTVGGDSAASQAGEHASQTSALCPSVSDPLDDIEKRWRIARELIAHEDSLVNHRLGWFLTLQAFLFAGLGVGANALVNGSDKGYGLLAHSLMLLMCLTGVWSYFLTRPGLRAARRQVRAVEFWWYEYGRSPHWAQLHTDQRWPPVKGRISYGHHYEKAFATQEPFFGPYLIPSGLALIWPLVALFLMYSLYQKWSTFSPPPRMPPAAYAAPLHRGPG